MPRAPRRTLLTEGTPEIPKEYLAQPAGDGEVPPSPPPTALAAPAHEPSKPRGAWMKEMSVDNPRDRRVISHTWVCLDSDGRPTGHPHFEWMGPIGGFPACPQCDGKVAIQLDVLYPAGV